MQKYFGFYKNLSVDSARLLEQTTWTTEHCMWPRDSYRQGHAGELPPFYNVGFWNETNTQFWQTKENDMDFDFSEVKSQIPIQDHTIGMIKLDPGTTLPWHKDSFYMLRQKRQDWKEQGLIPVRYLIFAEDWKIGHFVQLEDQTVSHWKAGDCWFFCYQTQHLGTNAGLEPMISIQVSGFQKNTL